MVSFILLFLWDYSKTVMKRFFTLICLLVCVTVSAQDECFNCFGIIAGKATTVDGSVMMAHNEDDGGEQMLNIYNVPASADNVKYLWFEFPGMEVADSFMNEFGVCVASDGCPSREDRKDFTEGGILYGIRVAVAKKAHSAREAVGIIGELVEKYGYSGSGRTYVVADPAEGWICSVVQGRHWVAQRVPDDMVMTIPNYYVIGKIDLSDADNFAGSSDIVDYAVSRGWYSPEKDGEFNFRLAYASERSLASESSIVRHTNMQNFLFGDAILGEDVVAVRKPQEKVTIEKLMEALSLPRVCNDNTILSTVFHLRGWLPVEIGCTAWNAMGHPNVELFKPWTFKTVIPDNCHRFKTAAEAEEKHFSDSKDKRANYSESFYWQYVDGWKSKVKDVKAQKKIIKNFRKADKKLTGSAD